MMIRMIGTAVFPFFILPRDAGEDTGGGLNGAKRLNDLNVLNAFEE